MLLKSQDKTEKIVLSAVTILISTIVFIVLASLSMAEKTESPKHTIEIPEDGVYVTKFGSVYCGEMQVTPCGVNLAKCTSERRYYCLHDVHIEERFTK